MLLWHFFYFFIIDWCPLCIWPLGHAGWWTGG